MQKIGISHRPRKPKGLTKADKEAQKSDDLLKRDFKADEPNKKCITDITELKAKDGRLYVSAIFDCFDLLVCGLAMDTNMKASLCTETVSNALQLHPELTGAVLHSDQGSQYTSEELLRKKLTWLFCNHSREKSHLLNCWNIKAELNLEMVIQ